MADRRVDARELRRRLVVKYGGVTSAVLMPEHIVMFEVPIDGRPRWENGRPARQRIDAVAVGVWARTRHLVHGFEIKCSRADLLTELRDPTKSAAGVAACDTWSLVLADKALLRDGDSIPDGWGVLAASGRGLGVVRAPEVRHGERDGRILAGMLQASLRSHGACRGLGHMEGRQAGKRYMRDAADQALWQLDLLVNHGEVTVENVQHAVAEVRRNLKALM